MVMWWWWCGGVDGDVVVVVRCSADTAGVFEAHAKLAEYFQRAADHRTAIHFYEKCLQVCDAERKAKTTLSLGRSHHQHHRPFPSSSRSLSLPPSIYLSIYLSNYLSKLIHLSISCLSSSCLSIWLAVICSYTPREKVPQRVCQV